MKKLKESLVTELIGKERVVISGDSMIALWLKLELIVQKWNKMK